jgi:hypothetical protein
MRKRNSTTNQTCWRGQKAYHRKIQGSDRGPLGAAHPPRARITPSNAIQSIHEFPQIANQLADELRSRLAANKAQCRGSFPLGSSTQRNASYRTLPKTRLTWNDRCQHLGLTWRRPEGRDEITKRTATNLTGAISLTAILTNRKEVPHRPASARSPNQSISGRWWRIVERRYHPNGAFSRRVTRAEEFFSTGPSAGVLVSGKAATPRSCHAG